MSDQRRETFQEQAERNVEATALLVARSIQAPGQTKEQTRLIAQGIAKGIALYKKQQSEKARERDKARKRTLKQRTEQTAEKGGTASPEAESEEPRSKSAALITAGTIFAAGAIMHLARYWAGLSVMVGGFPIPLWWSLAFASVAGGIGGWLLWLAWSGKSPT